MQLETLHKIGYGMYVVCSKKGSLINGQIANALIQVTAEPPTIAISINKDNLTHAYIESSKVFSVSIIDKNAPMTFIGNFGFKTGKNIDKFAGIKYRLGRLGVPMVVDNTVAGIEAEVISQISVGTHTIFIGRVSGAEIFNQNEPMTYAYYHDVKKGKSPKAAPTYLKEETSLKEENKMQKYVCKVCGYVYDPEKGDPDSNIVPGTAFESLPDDWVCPVCGAPKDQFEKIA